MRRGDKGTERRAEESTGKQRRADERRAQSVQCVVKCSTVVVTSSQAVCAYVIDAASRCIAPVDTHHLKLRARKELER
jgi:hypothetical protein